MREPTLPVLRPIMLIDASGAAVEHSQYALPPDDELLTLYRALIIGRRFNEQANALVRQGMLAVYPSSHGQEACQVAASSVLREQDWLFPTYRDSVAIVARGVDPLEVLTLLRGDWHCGFDPLRHNVAPHATPLATQLPHAVGVAFAARHRGSDAVAMALCGDGATSEGDFHEALNFAAVFDAPVVFLVQNNKYAISVPLDRQTAAPSLAHKGIGYGIPAVRVDGNDVAALVAVLGQAVRDAAAGGGPVLVEADTYRIQPHTNADDTSRYRAEDEVEPWRQRDPLLRLKNYLAGRGMLGEEREAGLAVEAEELAARLRTGLSAPPVLEPDDLFAHVYSTPTPQLVAQAALLREENAR